MLIIALAVPCAVTCLLETLALCFFKDGKKRMLPQLVCNLITNPTLHILLALGKWTFTSLTGGTDDLFFVSLLILLEIGVVFAEVWLLGFFFQEPFKKRLKISASLNTFSFLMGILLSEPLNSLILFLIK